MDAEKYDAGIRRDMANSFGGIKAGHDRHGQVQNHYVRGKLNHPLEGLGAVLRFATDVPLTLVRQEDTHTHAHYFVIVDNQQSYGNGLSPSFDYKI